MIANTSVYMASYVNFYDAGFQINFDVIGPNAITMEANTQFTLGAAAAATLFPSNYTPTSINFEHPSTVVYNAGVNQTVQSLSDADSSITNTGTSVRNYSHLTLTNSTPATVTKSLNGAVTIRGNLLIDPSNQLDVTASNHQIRLVGNWTDLGSFNARAGRVRFIGSALQTMSAGAAGTGTETYYNFTINNAATPTVANGSLTLASHMIITNSGTFTNGLVTANPITKITTFNDNTTHSGESNASFVDGMVRKIGDDAFVYPTGDYITTPRLGIIGISAPSLTTDHFTAQYFNKSPNALYSRTSKEVSINHVSSAEYWILDRTGGASNNTPTLYWDSPRSGGVATLSLMRVTKWDGTQWVNLGANNVTGNTTTGNLQPTSAVTTFSPFTFATDESGDAADNPLPIELLNFTAKAVDNKYTQLDWSTSTETNNDYFTIEKSKDEIHSFEFVAKVKGAGNSSKALFYDTQDLNPLSGLSYYRLKQTDFDGKFSYSKLEAVDFSSLVESFYVYPNPATTESGTEMHLTASENSEVLVVVYDISGKQYYSKVVIAQFNGDNIFALDLNNTLAKGVYYIMATTNDNIYKKKLVVQ